MAPQSELTQAQTPLLSVDAGDESSSSVQDQAKLDASFVDRFKYSALCFGFLIGTFIQCSTLGANFLAVNVYGQELVNKSKREIVLFSMVWSLITSGMAVIILGFMRNIVTATFNVVLQGVPAKHLSSRDHMETRLEEMIVHMECRFVVGALIGVCVAWTFTDYVLGMQAQVVYSGITLVLALLWCKIMLHYFAPTSTESPEPVKTILV
jgi:hypothetical protein